MHFVAILHDIRSVHNVGSIFRTADGAGFKKIYLCGVTPSPLDRFKKVRPDFAKVALGAERSVAWEHTEDVIAVIEQLKRDGWKILALEQSKKSTPYYRASDILRGGRNKSVALIVGNEIGGVPAAVLKLADAILEIPMLGEKESLNVSVAFGIAAYRLRFP